MNEKCKRNIVSFILLCEIILPNAKAFISTSKQELCTLWKVQNRLSNIHTRTHTQHFELICIYNNKKYKTVIVWRALTKACIKKTMEDFQVSLNDIQKKQENR